MSAEGTLMEPTVAPTDAAAAPVGRLISVVVPVVERSDDLVAVYRDGGFTPPPELVALSHEQPAVRLFSFARTFGETAALRLGIERSRGDIVVTLPAYFQV